MSKCARVMAPRVVRHKRSFIDMLPLRLCAPSSPLSKGKSTVSTLLSSKHHVQVIDLDVLARQVVEPNDPSRTLDHLVAYFGRSILQSDGTLDRPALGRMAFGEGNEAARRKLNAITHGAIRKRMMWNLVVNWFKGAKVTVVDTPLLVEAGLWKWCGQAAVVWW